MDLADSCEASAATESHQGTSSADEPLTALEQARLEWQAQVESQPEDATRRAGPSDITNHEEQPTATRSRKVPPSPEVVTGDTSEELLEPPTVDTFKEWTKAMLTDASGDRVDLPKLTSTFRSTKGLLVNGKQAIADLFGMKAFKAARCHSPERPDLQISQEEALGWLLAFARGRELLVEEARPIGKLAGTLGTEAKKELDTIRDSAKMRRSRARKKGASAAELADIDTAVTAQRAEITEASCEIKHMPANNTVIVERPAAKVDPIALRRRALEVMLGSQAALDAIQAAEVCEYHERDMLMAQWGYNDEFGDPLDQSTIADELELAQVQYRHALRRLKEAFPGEFNDCAADGTCEHRRVCRCDRGVRGGWPWVVQSPARGFCAGDEKRHHKLTPCGLYSCPELDREREWWLWAHGWGSADARAECLPSGQPRMPDERYREQLDAIRRDTRPS